MQITLTLACATIPTSHRLGLQRGTEIADLAPDEASQHVFAVPIEPVRRADGSLDWRGPYVHGKLGERFVYLVWSRSDSIGRPEMVGRAKIGLGHLTWDDVARAGDGGGLAATLALSCPNGAPVTATLKPPHIAW